MRSSTATRLLLGAFALSVAATLLTFSWASGGSGGGGGGGGGSPVVSPTTCVAGSSQTCSITERYLFIQQTYGVTLDVLDANGAVLATTSANVDTPTVPNPAAT